MIFVRMIFSMGLVLAGFQSPVSAATLDKVNELFQKSGMEEQVGDIALNAENGINQAVSQGAAITPELASELVSLYKESFSADVIRPEVISAISQKMTDAQIDQCLVWLNSDIGQKITQEEIKASNPSAYQEMMNYAQEYESNPPDAARVEAVNQLLEATHLLDYSATMMVTLQRTMIISMANPADYSSPRFEAMLRQIEDSKSVLKDRIRPQIEMGTYFAYRNISTPELKQYVDFLSSDVGLVYSEVSKDGLLNGMKVGGERLGRQMKERGKK